MIEVLLTMERFVFYALLATVVYYALSSKRNTSLLVTVLAVFLAELILREPIELTFPYVQRYLSPVMYKTYVYFFFTLSDLLAAFSILQLHKIYHQTLSLGARQASLGLLCLGFLQIVFFVLSFYLERSFFVDVYLISNSSLGIAISIMLFTCVAKDIVPFQISIKREKES